METDSGVTLPDPVVLDLELGSVEVLETMDVPVIVTRTPPGLRHGRIVFANGAALQFLGYERDELVGRENEFWQRPHGDSADLDAIGEALRSGEVVATEALARCKDGSERPVRVQMTPHRGAWGFWVISTALPMLDETGRSSSPGGRSQGRRNVSAGDLVLDPDARSIRYGQRQIELTPSECALLQALIEQAESVVERTALYKELWGFHPSIRSRAVDVYVGSLRRKLRELGAPDMIQTVRGVGYYLHH